MEKKVKTYLILTVLFGVLAGLLFVLIMPLAMRMEDSTIFALPVALLAVVAVRMYARRNTAKILVSVIEQIEASERTEIERLSFSPLEIESAARQMVSLMDQIEACDRIAVDDLIMPYAGNREIAYAVALLMRHGNLAEYELIANKLVAKKSLHLSAEDITEEGDVVVRKKEPEAVKCPSCGGNPGDSNYCPYCGCRLK